MTNADVGGPGSHQFAVTCRALDGMPFAELPHTILKKLAIVLEPESLLGRNWRDLAESLGLNPTVIQVGCIMCVPICVSVVIWFGLESSVKLILSFCYVSNW